MSTELCGSSLLIALPSDLFAIISGFLSPKDLCNLSLCCHSLYALSASEKVWFTQCQLLSIVGQPDLVEWRKGVATYKALCRFLISVQPLLGIWVYQNPELGNVVYVLPGFVSVVGCRIIPQELGPLGIEDGPILWAPVFEILGDLDGSTVFFLHGREKGSDYCYPGLVKAVDKTCNVLLLEVDPGTQISGGNLLHSKRIIHRPDKKIFRSSSGLSRSQRVLGQSVQPKVPFSRLAFSDRRKLLEIVMNRVRMKVPDPANGPLFPPIRDNEENSKKDMEFLLERRSVLMRMYKLGGGQFDWKASSELPADPSTHLEMSEIRRSLSSLVSSSSNSMNEDDDPTRSCTKRKTLGRYFKDSLNQILRKPISFNGNNEMLRNGSSSGPSKHAQVDEFLRSGDTIGLALNASSVKLLSYRAWPNMHENRFALYKLPMRVPTAEQEYAGLWGGTFGWPPGKPSEDKPGKALFFLFLSYEESEGERNIIATKILEGTHYVLHPNGSAMFIANIDEPSVDPFPWDVDGDSVAVNVKHAFTGEGIANGYGFRYPGSELGSLYEFDNSHLAFVWKESRAVLTLQRLNLQEVLRKGERVPALPPIVNFSYLTKSYSNVYVGFPNTLTSFSSPRQRQS